MPRPLFALAALILCVGCDDEGEGLDASTDASVDVQSDIQSDGPSTNGPLSGLTVPDEADVLTYYQWWIDQREQIQSNVAALSGTSPFAFSESDYSSFLATLDLTDNTDLMVWAATFDITVISVNQGPNFFYYDAHLYDGEMPEPADYSPRDGPVWKNDYVEETKQVQLCIQQEVAERTDVCTSQDTLLPTRQIPESTIRQIEITRVDGVDLRHNEGFVRDNLTLEVLEDWLVPLSSVSRRDEIESSVARLPLSYVNLLRGKGIVLSEGEGRSFSAATSLSNNELPYYAGLIPSVFLEYLTGLDRGYILVHELCHMIDSTAIARSSSLFPFQYPDARDYFQRRNEAFSCPFDGARPCAPNFDNINTPSDAAGPSGFISVYSTANDLENFAEHCAAYFERPAAFKSKAEEEQQSGAPALMVKYTFFEDFFGDAHQAVRLTADNLGQFKP